jgi:hypothetical protein
MRWYLSWFLAAFLLTVAIPAVTSSDEGKWINLSENGLAAWKEPTGQWQIVGGISPHPDNPRLLASQPGEGVLVNGPKGRTNNLISKEQFGDIEVHVEFLIPSRSNSGVKLMGQYEIQIMDSAGVKTPTANDCGGIYPRAEPKPTYHHIDKGYPPRTNAARPAGEWQTLDIIFQAPRFDDAGKKIASARFVKVVLNGQVIHENVEVLYPTGAAWHDKEMARGPLLLQADHGPVAFRNVRVRPYAAEPRKK